MTKDVEKVAEAMYEMVRDYDGKRKLKPMDLIKAMIERFGGEICDKKSGKRAIRILIDGGRCTYSYVGGGYVVLNPNHQG